MAFTLDQIAAIEDGDFTPEVETALFAKLGNRPTTFLTNSGHIVKPKADYDTEVENIVKTRNQEAIDKEAAQFYASIDTMLTAATGKTKPDKMKTRDWVTELEKEGLVPFTPAQIEKLKRAMAGDPRAEGILADLQKKVDKFEEDKTSESTAILTKAVNRLVKTDLRNAPVAIDATAKTEAEKTKAKNEGISDLTDFFNSKYEGKEDKEGEIYFVKKGTETALMNSTENRAMTPLEIIQANHKTFLAVQGHQQQGGGTGKNQDGGATIPKTAQDVITLASAQGLRFMSPEFNKFVQDKKKELNIK